MSKQSGGGNLSHKKHRTTGGPFCRNRGRRNPKEVMHIAFSINAAQKCQREMRERLKPEMFSTVQEAMQLSR